MTFHPDHQRKGIEAALKSPKTPAHLKPHLQARLSKVPKMEAAKPKLMKKPNAKVDPFFGGY